MDNKILLYIYIGYRWDAGNHAHKEQRCRQKPQFWTLPPPSTPPKTKKTGEKAGPPPEETRRTAAFLTKRPIDCLSECPLGRPFLTRPFLGHGYRLELIVAFLEREDDGQVRLWYSHHERYSRKKKNLRWKLDDTHSGGKTTYRERDTFHRQIRLG